MQNKYDLKQPIDYTKDADYMDMGDLVFNRPSNVEILKKLIPEFFEEDLDDNS